MVTAIEVSSVPAKRRNAPKTATWRQENFLSIGPLSKPDLIKEIFQSRTSLNKRVPTKTVANCRVNVENEREVCGCDAIVFEFFREYQSEILNHRNHKYLPKYGIFKLQICLPQ